MSKLVYPYTKFSDELLEYWDIHEKLEKAINEDLENLNYDLFNLSLSTPKLVCERVIESAIDYRKSGLDIINLLNKLWIPLLIKLNQEGVGRDALDDLLLLCRKTIGRLSRFANQPIEDQVINDTSFQEREYFVQEYSQFQGFTGHMIAGMNWLESNKPYYRISKNLSINLLNTELRGYPSDQLKLPHDFFYLDLSNVDFMIGDLIIDGAYCSTVNESFMIELVSSSYGDQDVEIAMITLKFFVDLQEGLSLDESLARVNFPEKLPEGSDKVVQKLFSYIINVVLYATMTDADKVYQHFDPNYQKTLEKLRKHPKGSRKHTKAREALRGCNKERYYNLGGSIKVDRNLEALNKSGAESGRSVGVRFIVSGHWRNQPCGPSRSQIKRIWVKPYWKGPEYAPITSKPHELV